MPISTNSKMREKQISNLKPFDSKDGYRQTKPIRFYLPVELAEKWESMNHKVRNSMLEELLKTK